MILGAAVVGLFTIDFDNDNNVATGPGAETTTTFPSASTAAPSTEGTTATTTAATTASTSASTAATTAATTATTSPATTAGTTATTSSVGGTSATTAPGSGLGANGSGQVGQNPLATSGGISELVPALLLAAGALLLRIVTRKAAVPR